MHYVICYDLESDQKRAYVVKTLEKHGCRRVQKSVFVAPEMEKRDLTKLRNDLKRAWTRADNGPSDSIIVVPLGSEMARAVLEIGNNKVFTKSLEIPAKIIL